ncbi:hypothetical protein BJ741DRAFT_270987 [Chytriomyces cf. hyalinus JEL632]|nr:hypothetical protein BJ741DRAFT_270987 [Chytriomyces cf. hyalinus JEL632]
MQLGVPPRIQQEGYINSSWIKCITYWGNSRNRCRKTSLTCGFGLIHHLSDFSGLPRALSIWQSSNHLVCWAWAFLMTAFLPTTSIILSGTIDNEAVNRSACRSTQNMNVTHKTLAVLKGFVGCSQLFFVKGGGKTAEPIECLGLQVCHGNMKSTAKLAIKSQPRYLRIGCGLVPIFLLSIGENAWLCVVLLFRHAVDLKHNEFPKITETSWSNEHGEDERRARRYCSSVIGGGIVPRAWRG